MKKLVTAFVAAQLVACATTHEVGRVDLSVVGRVASGAAEQASVFDRDGAEVVIRGESELVLHLAAGGRYSDVTVRPEQLRVSPEGLWLPDGLYLPAEMVMGMRVREPRHAEQAVLVIFVSLAVIGATFAFYAVASDSDPEPVAVPGRSN